MNIYSIPLICFAFGVLPNGVFVLFKRNDHIAHRFFTFSLAIFGWGFLSAIWFDQNLHAENILLWVKASFVFAVFIPITWAHFVFNFIDKKEPFKNFYLFGYLFSGALAISTLTPWFVSGLHSMMDAKIFVTPGPFYHPFALLFFTLVPYTFAHLFHTYCLSSGETKKQLMFLLIGTLIAFTVGGALFLSDYNVPCPQFFLVLIPLYPLLTGLAMIRYRLFDVQEIADAFQREKMAVLGTMAASLNHEIKNPIFIVRGKAESYLDAVDRDKYQSFTELKDAGQTTVNLILNHANRALDIIQRFTDFARPFNIKADKETVVLSEVFKEVQELVSSEFSTGNVALAHNLTNGVAITANRRHIEEIFSNLVMNACHAIGSKGGQVSVFAKSAGNKIRVEVSDTGEGIPEENLTRLFEPFFTTKDKKGSGLGLYITKQLVERNGGKISVRSKMGEGTSFVLEFKR